MTLILEAKSRAFPPRLPEQPIFYPVLNFNYAEQIARDWNTKSARSGYAGFVTRFEVDEEYVDGFEEHVVGTSTHRELWIPSEELKTFNEHIHGRIEIAASYYGEEYKGIKHWYRELYADEMFHMFYHVQFNAQDFSGEVTLNRHAIQLNYEYWVSHDYKAIMTDEQKTTLLHRLQNIWQLKFPDSLLGNSDQTRLDN